MLQPDPIVKIIRYIKSFWEELDASKKNEKSSLGSRSSYLRHSFSSGGVFHSWSFVAAHVMLNSNDDAGCRG